jgi:prepilin-type N-terminal cleavage/methylation domain-containing protein
MTLNFKRTVARGFTLIELLIVVIILAIIAAIAIPQFSASTADAQASALDSNLAAVRTALEQYKVQHTGNVYPGAVASAGGVACPGGGTSIAATVGANALREQLTGYTNAAGEVCGAPGGAFRFGPYLRQGIPSEPINNSIALEITSTGARIVPAAATGGWAYDTLSGQFVMNSNANDGSTPARAYSAH